MKFVLYIKDDIAVASAREKSHESINISGYDRYEEITETEFNNIELPAKKINGIWCKTDEYPSIEYPAIEGSEEPTETEQLRADIDYIAVMTGVEL